MPQAHRNARLQGYAHPSAWKAEATSGEAVDSYTASGKVSYLEARAFSKLVSISISVARAHRASITRP